MKAIVWRRQICCISKGWCCASPDLVFPSSIYLQNNHESMTKKIILKILKVLFYDPCKDASTRVLKILLLTLFWTCVDAFWQQYLHRCLKTMVSNVANIITQAMARLEAPTLPRPHQSYQHVPNQCFQHNVDTTYSLFGIGCSPYVASTCLSTSVDEP